jgi:hypothetical protein
MFGEKMSKNVSRIVIFLDELYSETSGVLGAALGTGDVI